MNVTLSQILADLTRRLPKGWFGRTALTTGVIFSILFGFATVFAGIMAINQYVALQVYVQTSSGGFLDLWAYDFFGDNLLRKPGESDTSWLKRIQAYLFAPMVTREAVSNILQAVTGSVPTIIELWRGNDTAVFDSQDFAFNVASRFGSRQYPATALIQIAPLNTTVSTNTPGFNSTAGLGAFNQAASGAFFSPEPEALLSLSDVYDAIGFVKAEGVQIWVQTT